MDGNLSEDTKCQMPKYKGCVDYDIPLDVAIEPLNYCCFSHLFSLPHLGLEKNYSAKKKTEKKTYVRRHFTRYYVLRNRTHLYAQYEYRQRIILRNERVILRNILRYFAY